jgi:hypothetical protein
MIGHLAPALLLWVSALYFHMGVTADSKSWDKMIFLSLSALNTAAAGIIL